MERLAVGGMAELFLAEASGAHGFNKTIVIKRLLPHLARDAHFNAMFIDEAKLTARLAHPKIAQTYELGRYDDQLYIAMEFVDGIDALSMLRECAHRRVRIPAEVAVYIAHEILDALDFAHNQVDAEGRAMGVVHRDISPSNVLLSRRGDVKLVDFGIARAAERSHNTKAGTLKGKYGYMSPEQVIDAEVDGRSDLFSVGIVLAEMLTGRRLFAAGAELDVLLMVRDARLERLDRYGADIEPELNRIVRRALRKNAADRYAGAAEMRDALDQWLFEQRKRVTARQVAEIVESLYDDAWKRKRQGMVDEDRARADVVEGAPVSSISGREATLGADGIPLGLGRGPAESGPVMIIDDPARVETSDAAGAAPAEAPDDDEAHTPVLHRDRTTVPKVDGVPVAMSAEAAAAEHSAAHERVHGDEHTAVARPRARPERAPSDSDFHIEVGDLVHDRGKVPSLAETGTIVVDESEAAPQLVGDDVDISVRFPSIEAAVASLSPKNPDPSTIDFDDIEVAVTDGGRRARPTRLPSVDELVSAPEPPPPSLDEIEGDPDDSGEFTETPPIAVLYRLAVSRATGLLVVTVGGIRKEVYFREGIPEYVSSNVAGELLGAYLVKSEVITPGELAMALAMMPHYGGRLGDTLVGLGLLKPLEVFRWLTRQVRDKLIDVCTWNKGTFRWYGGRENPREAFPLDLNSFEVLAAGVMAMPEAHLESWVAQMSAVRPRSLRNAKITPEQFELGAAVRDVYDNLDGRRTVQELYERYTEAQDRRQFLRVLYLLVHTGLAKAA